MGIKCVLYVKDEIYGKRLVNSISERSNRRFAIDRVSSREELEVNETAEGMRGPDVVVTDEDSYYEELKNIKGVRIVVLTEEHMSVKQMDASYGEDIMGVWKYQTVDNVCRQIVEGMGIGKKQRLLSSEVIGIYSPVNAEPRQAFALNVAKVLSEKYKVIYVDTGVFSGLSQIMPASDGGGLSDVLYYYRQGKEGCVDKIKDIVNNVCGVDYIASVRCGEDLSCMGKEDVGALIDCITKSNNYEIVVLDIHFNDGRLASVLEMCSEVYMPVKDDYSSVNKVKEFENLYCETGKEDLLERIIKVKLPEGELGISEEFWGRVECGGMYRYVKSLFKQDQSKYKGCDIDECRRL